MRIDSTYPKVSFTYEDNVGQVLSVSTLEEEEYPSFYYKTTGDTKNEGGDTAHILADETESISGDSSIASAKVLKEQHRSFQENQKGISYDILFGPYLRGASQIIITDPYIRLFYQVRNLMEFIESAVKFKSQDEEIAIHLITAEDDFKADHQAESLEKIKESCAAIGIHFTWEFDGTGTIHARHIVTDNGWKILLDRGLDIFQNYEMNDAFTFANRLQQHRACKAFEVTFIKNELGSINSEM
jgi:ATP-dependent Lon protease